MIEPHGELDGCLHLLAHVDVSGDPVEIRVLSIDHDTRKGVNCILDKEGRHTVLKINCDTRKGVNCILDREERHTNLDCPKAAT